MVHLDIILPSILRSFGLVQKYIKIPLDSFFRALSNGELGEFFRVRLNLVKRETSSKLFRKSSKLIRNSSKKQNTFSKKNNIGKK